MTAGVEFTRIGTNANTSEGNFLVDGTPGNAVQYQVVLTQSVYPGTQVVIDFASSDTTEGTVTPQLTFTSANWNVAQTVTIQGVDDMASGGIDPFTELQAPEGATAYTISATINQDLTDDLDYVTAFVPTFTLQNDDDVEDIPVNGGPDSPYSNIGTSAVDYMVGGNLNDQLYGGYGFDSLKGGFGDDKLYGEQGNDRLYGQQGNDQLYGGYQNDILYGDNGNDKLYGEQDADKLYGGNGNDWLDGGLGADQMTGGVGNDTYVVDDILDVITDGGSSTDVDNAWIQITAGAYNLGASLENAVIKTDADVGINGNAQNNILTGGIGANKLNGGWGNDKLNGNAGNDTLLGAAGNDVLTGGAGTDNLNGGSENDNLNGGAGNDVLVGGTGNDVAVGGDNNDKIVAGDGTDSINGGTGNDVIDGGNGNDTITLGAGSDTLYCGNYTGTDKVTDYNPTYDTIKLEDTVFSDVGSSVDSGEFVVGTAPQDSNDYLYYNSGTGGLYYDEDGSGAAASQLVVMIGININITVADFIVA